MCQTPARSTSPNSCSTGPALWEFFRKNAVLQGKSPGVQGKGGQNTDTAFLALRLGVVLYLPKVGPGEEGAARYCAKILLPRRPKWRSALFHRSHTGSCTRSRPLSEKKKFCMISGGPFLSRPLWFTAESWVLGSGNHENHGKPWRSKTHSWSEVGPDIQRIPHTIAKPLFVLLLQLGNKNIYRENPTQRAEGASNLRALPSDTKLLLTKNYSQIPWGPKAH